MSFFRAHYERIAAGAGIVFLLGCAAIIWLRALSFAQNFTTLPPAASPKQATPTAPALAVQNALENLASPPQWTALGRSGLFVPEKHFIGPDGLPATLQTTEVHPPVPNEWLDQHGLPIAEADVLMQDPDGDGFNNLEEWEGKTTPTDNASHPPYATKLKLKSFNREPFRLVFASHAGGSFGINTSDLKEPTQFVQMGGVVTVGDAKFKLVNFTPRTETNQQGGEVDVSELTLENMRNKERIVLVKEKVMISPESVGTFLYTWGEPREMVIKKDQEFSLPPETQTSYKLVDVQAGRAVIVNTQKPEERIEIRPLNP